MTKKDKVLDWSFIHQKMGIDHHWSGDYNGYIHEDINDCVFEGRLTCNPDNWYRDINTMVVRGNLYHACVLFSYYRDHF